MCNDAEQKGDTKKPAAMARFISDVAHAGRAMESQVDIALGNIRIPPGASASWWRRMWGRIFPLSRI